LYRICRRICTPSSTSCDAPFSSWSKLAGMCRRKGRSKRATERLSGCWAYLDEYTNTSNLLLYLCLVFPAFFSLWSWSNRFLKNGRRLMAELDLPTVLLCCLNECGSCFSKLSCCRCRLLGVVVGRSAGPSTSLVEPRQTSTQSAT